MSRILKFELNEPTTIVFGHIEHDGRNKLASQIKAIIDLRNPHGGTLGLRGGA